MLNPRVAIDLQRAGRLAEAENIYRSAISKDPADAQALNLLGMLLHESGGVDEGMRLLRRSIELAPNVPELLSNVGAVLGKSGRHEEAILHLTKALQLRPLQPQTLYNLGVACEHAGRVAESERAYRAAIDLTPKNAEAHNGLGNLLRKVGRLDDAIECHRRAIELRPDYADGYASLAAACGELGRQSEAVAHCRKVVELRPASARDHSNLLYAMHYDESIPPGELFEEHLTWGRRHARPVGGAQVVHGNDRAADRVLRVGYVSPDFRQHAIFRFIEPLLEHHDRSYFEIFCYSDVSKPDAATQRLKNLPVHWRDWNGMTDEQAADAVRADRIDILVDLAGHGAGNRLLVFARKPAPVQIAMIGYPDTTGLSAMHYRITDAEQDPPGMTERMYSEKLLRLSRSAWCYRPDPDGPPVAELPATSNGFITFGCLNKLVKITPTLMMLWSEILGAVPGSRLLLAAKRGERTNPSIRHRLIESGLPSDRVEIMDKSSDHRSYLERYNRIDIALDSFPYNGATTTCDALWMGVPVLTLCGKTTVSRAAASLLTTIGRDEFIADTPAEYVRHAIALAADTNKLADQRASLRETMKRSALRDELSFVRAVEQSYRFALCAWCAASSS